MRIAFDHQIFAFQTYGGISRYFVRLAERLATLPAIAPSITAPLYVNAYLPGLRSGIVRGISVPATNLNRKIARRLGNLLAPPMISLTRPTIVHETYFSARGSAPRGVPTILTVYDMIHERFADQYAANDATSDLKQAAVRRADHVLCISESTRRDLIELIPEAEAKSSVTLLGFDPFDRLDTAPASAVAAPYLLYVGERTRYKNFVGLLRAFAASTRLRRDFHLVCFGGGPLTSAELVAIADLGLGANDVVQRSGDDAALADCYRDAAAFIYPSLYEGFGIPPLEAMSASCAVVAADRSSIPEICGDAAAYFAPNDIEAMRAAIEHVVDDATVAATLVERGHERLKRFSWDRCADETLAAYRKLAG